MSIPKMYAPTRITFWSLRDTFGYNWDVVNDVDTKVTRKCMRVATKHGWKWQICNYIALSSWDYEVVLDQECLNAYIEELEYE